MSSDALQDVLTAILQNDYISVALVTAIGYDYVLTFSEEIEYIWNRPWTWVSTLFIPIRYLGLFNLVVSSLGGSSLLPGTAKTYVFVLSPSDVLHTTKIYPTVVSIYAQGFSDNTVPRYLQGQTIAIVSGWTFLLFLGAADFVMVLRVWAMYSRSRLIIGTLLTLYSAVITATVLSVAVNSIPKNLPAEIVQVLNFSFCTITSTVPMWTNVAVILQVVQGGVMCMLAIAQVVKQSIEMYRATRGWQLNRYTSLLVKQGILSFLAILLFNFVNVLSVFGKAPTGGWQLLLLLALEYVPIYTLTPRFILSMRKMYACDPRRTRGGGIDSGFGWSSSVTGMVFANATQKEDIAELQMEVRAAV